jgi:hypothetical protein
VGVLPSVAAGAPAASSSTEAVTAGGDAHAADTAVAARMQLLASRSRVLAPALHTPHDRYCGRSVAVVN